MSSRESKVKYSEIARKERLFKEKNYEKESSLQDFTFKQKETPLQPNDFNGYVGHIVKTSILRKVQKMDNPIPLVIKGAGSASEIWRLKFNQKGEVSNLPFKGYDDDSEHSEEEYSGSEESIVEMEEQEFEDPRNPAQNTSTVDSMRPSASYEFYANEKQFKRPKNPSLISFANSAMLREGKIFASTNNELRIYDLSKLDQKVRLDKKISKLIN